MGGRVRTQAAAPPPDPARTGRLLATLQKVWGHAVCELDHENAFQLLVATILSAQSTDRRINLVTPALFARYPDAASLAEADQAELEEMVRSTGFYRNKTKSLLGMARALVSKHGGQVPDTMEDLVALPGVARKTANVVLGVAKGIQSGIAVDTHVKRVSGLLGLTSNTDPVKIERDLMAIVPQANWSDFSQQVIWHGRRVCHARKPNCAECALAPDCPSREVA